MEDRKAARKFAASACTTVGTGVVGGAGKVSRTRPEDGAVFERGRLDKATRGNGSLRLGLAGFAATAVAYGPARVGYGLFVPDFREAFGLSTGAAGLVGSGLQAGMGTIAGLGAGDLVGPLTLARPPASVTLPRPQTLPR